MPFVDDFLLFSSWKYKSHIIIRYTKPKGQIPDYNQPVVMKQGSSIEDFCDKLHKSIMKQFK